MMTSITENLGSLIVGAGLLALVTGIVAAMVRRRRSGKPAACGGGCQGCPGASICHK